MILHKTCDYCKLLEMEKLPNPAEKSSLPLNEFETDKINFSSCDCQGKDHHVHTLVQFQIIQVKAPVTRVRFL